MGDGGITLLAGGPLKSDKLLILHERRKIKIKIEIRKSFMWRQLVNF